MSDTRPQPGRTWTYRFSEPDGTEIDTLDLEGNEAAEESARAVSRSRNVAVVVRRHSGHVDAWEYVIEVDERH